MRNLGFLQPAPKCAIKAVSGVIPQIIKSYMTGQPGFMFQRRAVSRNDSVVALMGLKSFVSTIFGIHGGKMIRLQNDDNVNAVAGSRKANIFCEVRGNV